MMNVVVYYARCYAHPEFPPSINERLWPIMARRVSDMGYRITMLTTPKSGADKLEHDELIEIGEDAEGKTIDPGKCALAREQAWHRYLRDWLPDGEQALMIEPDIYLHKRVPPLEDADLLLLRRGNNPFLTCFRLCTNKAEPYYARMRRIAMKSSDDRQRWYADIDAQEQIIGAKSWPFGGEIEGVKVKVSDWNLYLTHAPETRSGYAWAFNGRRKLEMLGYA